MKQWILNEIKKLKLTFAADFMAAPVKKAFIHGFEVPGKYQVQQAFVQDMKMFINLAMMKDPLTMEDEKDKTQEKFAKLLKDIDALEGDASGSEFDQEISDS